MEAFSEVLPDVTGPAVELALVHPGGPTVGPVVFVVDVAMSGLGSATRPLTVAVAGDDGPALRGAPNAGFPADIQYLGVGADNDAGQRAVASDHPQSVDVDDVATLGFVKTAGDAS